MNWIEALVLGLIQGLTEFLPVSSSGHLELGKVLLNTNLNENLQFSIAVHGATVLSTMVVFRKDLLNLIKDFFLFRNNQESLYGWKILFSMIPVGLLGLLFSDQIEALFHGNTMMVGGMLIFTSLVLALTKLASGGTKPISFKSAFLIGIAQALAVIPGISRSGLTISMGLYLGNKKDEVARFSFLMVILPIIGANLMEVFKGDYDQYSEISLVPILVGFVSAFVAGLLACKWMIRIVKKGNIFYFAVYCFVLGILAITFF